MMAKGESFELIVFNAMKVALAADRLGLSSNAARMFHRKGYRSRDRNSEIIVDIAIEVWPPDANHYAILWVCECKDYGRAVPVDDVEEFKAKLDQIAGKNVKGVIASRGALQRSALEYARSQGIGVVRVLPDEQVRWMLRSMDSSDTLSEAELLQAASALTQQDFQAINRSLFGIGFSRPVREWHSLIRLLADGPIGD